MTLATVALAPAYNPASWSTFFTLTGTVAATLTGLFFVAFSLRVRDLQLSVVIRTRAAYLLALLVVIVVYSAFVLMPGQSRAAGDPSPLTLFRTYLVWLLRSASAEVRRDSSSTASLRRRSMRLIPIAARSLGPGVSTVTRFPCARNACACRSRA